MLVVIVSDCAMLLCFAIQGPFTPALVDSPWNGNLVIGCQLPGQLNSLKHFNLKSSAACHNLNP